MKMSDLWRRRGKMTREGTGKPKKPRTRKKPLKPRMADVERQALEIRAELEAFELDDIKLERVITEECLRMAKKRRCEYLV